MKKLTAAVFVLSFAALSLPASGFAQSHLLKSDSKSHDTAAATTTAASPSTAAPASSSSTSTSIKPADLNSMLTDADSVVGSTNTDLANLRTDKWASGWKTGFIKKSSHKQQASQVADTLKLQAGALPGMISDVRSSHGSVGATFKLYNNLTMVCENLDILAEATQNYGKKDDYTKLSTDYTNLLRLRASLSSYVEQRAALVDPRGNVSSSSTATAKKDDTTAPKKHIAKSRKKPASASGQ